MIMRIKSRNDRRSNLFSLWRMSRGGSRSTRRGRPLAAEVLESRLALSGVPLPADGSLADYLAQSPELGPHLPQAGEVGEIAPATLENASVQAADELAAVLIANLNAPPVEDAPEGESLSPILTSFTVSRVDGGFVRLAGTVTDGDSMMINVSFGGLFAGSNALADSSGYFVTYESDPGYGGFVTAQAMDDSSNVSNVLTNYLA